ncbi:MAG: glycosyltransferase family 9 protein [Cytophagales bacterium]|nr:glycosyltransferase family 9 protein [Cytophagales bacterium]
MIPQGMEIGKMPKMLIIQTAFIGDVILASGLIEKLHAHFPEGKIDFLLRKGNEGLLLGHPHLHRVLVFDKKRKYANLLKLVSELRAEKYDLVVNVQRFATTGVLTALSGARYTSGFDKNPLSFLFSLIAPHVISNDPEEALHEVERNHALIVPFTDGQYERPKLYPSEADYEKTAPYKQQEYVCIAPTSVWFTKQFPQEQWVKFLDLMPAKYKVYLLGAPSDTEACEKIRKSSSNAKVEILAGKISLLESAALMKDARMNYVNDSAPMHLCSAVNAPVCAVYCSTVPRFGFGPLSDESHVVEIDYDLSCRPCGLHGYKKCPEGHFKCGYDVSLDRLLELLG